MLNLTFDSILPEEIPSYDGHLVLTTKKEAPLNCAKPLLYEEILEEHITIIRGLMIQKLTLGYDNEELIIGIDPGHRTGLSVFYYGHEIESSFYSSTDKLVNHVTRILGGLRAKRKIVKIGNGNMNIARQISQLLNLHFCSSFDLEFVDERKTSLKIKNFNQRGKRDMLSAKYILHRDGYRHFILPLSITG